MITFILILLLLGSGFISGFLLASTKDLQAVRILQVRDVIISEEEFVFNLVFEGFNPGFFSIEIQDVELDIFAKSSHAKDEDYYKISTEEDEGYSFASNGVIDMQEQDDGQLQTVLLGNIRHFEVPLKFQGGFFTRQKVVVVSEVKIIHPCSDDDDDDNGPATSTSTSPTTTTTTTVNLNPTSTGSENHPPNPPFKDPNNRFGINKGKTKKPPKGGEKKWVKLSQYPFDLIVRGVLKYNLPILKEYKSLAVNKIVTIDPDNLR
ncbi:hypothetical protein PACTADRAFT_49568 [Pachysolen tannophilus NRRL Y-2460]|uniref:Late embryogenesis abundant protein LEA-2 subgroup domain-containing protein n=1 Tax=Pachysolen tannophilus NRRL Y-2460 TaxID=669874 RepID=A0A1E4TWN8_PACTA|nr:hypothetical protein PACTADRAFT_49568 [Pachysolen tannophilus NRRL Y-2460]